MLKENMLITNVESCTKKKAYLPRRVNVFTDCSGMCAESSIIEFYFHETMEMIRG